MRDRPPPQPITQVLTHSSAEAAAYARLWSPVLHPMGQHLVQALPLGGTRHILDVGTGTGALLPDLQAAAPDALVVGVDPAVGMLRLACTPNAPSLAVMDARRLGFRSARFDAVLLAFVLFHLPGPVRDLADVFRVLRPDGAIGVATWGTGTACPAWNVWGEELDAYGVAPDPTGSVDREILMDTPAKLSILLEQADFAGTRAWTTRFEHRWEAQELWALRTGFGASRRRLETLDPSARAACLDRIRTRLATLPPAAFVFRPEVVFAVARRPLG